MKNLKFTLKAWPVITAVTIGLCFLTQWGAKVLFYLELPEQANIELMKRYAGWNLIFFFLCTQILVIMPTIEELVFRGLLFKLPCKLRRGGHALPRTAAVLSSVLFSAAHYLAQPWPDAAFLALFFFGLAQCWLYSKTTQIWCPILNHFLFNLTNLALLFILPTPTT